ATTCGELSSRELEAALRPVVGRDRPGDVGGARPLVLPRRLSPRRSEGLVAAERRAASKAAVGGTRDPARMRESRFMMARSRDDLRLERAVVRNAPRDR